ncbi:MAG: hypothetical protein MHPSP_002053, partial [Paramarteilia canceri]
MVSQSRTGFVALALLRNNGSVPTPSGSGLDTRNIYKYLRSSESQKSLLCDFEMTQIKEKDSKEV